MESIDVFFSIIFKKLTPMAHFKWGISHLLKTASIFSDALLPAGNSSNCVIIIAFSRLLPSSANADASFFSFSLIPEFENFRKISATRIVLFTTIAAPLQLVPVLE